MLDQIVSNPTTAPLRIAIVGAGLVGAGWAIVFARAGLQVAIFDQNAVRRQTVLGEIAISLDAMQRHELIAETATILSRLRVCDTLEEALSGADYVQESVIENVELKRTVASQIAATLGPATIVGSSTSGLPASAFTEHVASRDRFIVAHPVNPPHLVPVVEIVPAPWTDAAVAPWVHALMTRVGQAPIHVNREIPGFILNRLQGALLDEAWHLFDEGYASAADIDKTISQGLGLRWSFMGPFETIDLNAPLGIDDYARRLGPMYFELAQGRPAPQPWPEDTVDRAKVERRDALPVDKIDARRQWRDDRLMALAAHRSRQKD